MGKEKLTFEITGLLSRDNKGNVRGPFSPISTVNAIVEVMKIPVNGLARVHFNISNVNNVYEEGEGYTSYDTLVIKSEIGDSILYFCFIDEGISFCTMCVFDTNG